jgi:hypothetical protein
MQFGDDLTHAHANCSAVWLFWNVVARRCGWTILVHVYTAFSQLFQTQPHVACVICFCGAAIAAR